MIQYNYQIVLRRKSDPEGFEGERLGVVELTGEVYGDRTDTDALTEAMTELKVVGPFYQWRDTLIQATDFRALKASLLMAADLSAAEPDPVTEP